MTFADHKVPGGATEGALRLCRRGSELHMLSRDAGRETFRYIGSFPVDPGPTINGGIQLLATALNGGRSQGHWTSLEIRAEKLLAGSDAYQYARLHVMNSDGSGKVRQITRDLNIIGRRLPTRRSDAWRSCFDLKALICTG